MGECGRRGERREVSQWMFTARVFLRIYVRRCVHVRASSESDSPALVSRSLRLDPVECKVTCPAGAKYRARRIASNFRVNTLGANVARRFDAKNQCHVRDTVTPGDSPCSIQILCDQRQAMWINSSVSIVQAVSCEWEISRERFHENLNPKIEIQFLQSTLRSLSTAPRNRLELSPNRQKQIIPPLRKPLKRESSEKVMVCYSWIGRSGKSRA